MVTVTEVVKWMQCTAGVQDSPSKPRRSLCDHVGS